MSIPQVNHAIIGGSSTFATAFPDMFLQSKEIAILNNNLVFSTPFGPSPAFKLFTINDVPVLTCKMHGWRKGVPRGLASQQIFWVFREAGVKNILAEGGVGAINTKFAPRDLIIPSDYIDYSCRKAISITDDYLLIMRDPFCNNLRDSLLKTVKENLQNRNLFTEAVYCNTDGRHFESKAEIKMMASNGGDIVGQSICPEVYLAREIGACYAGIYMVVNYAEGVIAEWDYEEFKNIFWQEGENIGKILIETLKSAFLRDKKCPCHELRRETLLKNSKVLQDIE